MLLNTIKTNVSNAKTRFDTYLGKQYLVVPMVMLTVGVHAGSNGPLLYNEDELAKFPESWNKKPVVVYHPTINGKGVSACNPSVLESHEIGTIFNTSFGDGRLTAEAWIDVERADLIDDRIIKTLEEGKMIEVSTGLFSDNEMTEGTWNDEDYIAVTKNYRPDHLAILPDKKGACSIEDGAGLLRNEASHDRIRSMLHDALRARMTTDEWYLEEVYQTFAIVYSYTDSKHYKIGYTHSETEATLDSEMEEVVRVIEYRTLEGTFVGNAPASLPTPPKKETSTMDKKLFVAALVTLTSNAFAETDSEFLMTMNEDQLRKIAPSLNDDGTLKETDEPTANEDPAPAAPAPAAPAFQTNATPAQPDFNAWLNSAPAEFRDLVSNGIAAANAQKERLIATITSNARNRFTPEQLNVKPLGELQAIADLAQQTAAPVANDFSGLGDAYRPPAPVTPVVNVEPLALPTWED